MYMQRYVQVAWLSWNVVVPCMQPPKFSKHQAYCIFTFKVFGKVTLRISSTSFMFQVQISFGFVCYISFGKLPVAEELTT
jgi:hypothetical protein